MLVHVYRNWDARWLPVHPSKVILIYLEPIIDNVLLHGFMVAHRKHLAHSSVHPTTICTALSKIRHSQTRSKQELVRSFLCFQFLSVLLSAEISLLVIEINSSSF